MYAELAYIDNVPNSDKLLSPLLSVTIVSVHCQYFFVALYDLLFDTVCVLLMSFVYWTNPALSCDQFLYMSPNSLEEMCNELLEVTDLVTYTYHGAMAVLAYSSPVPS